MFWRACYFTGRRHLIEFPQQCHEEGGITSVPWMDKQAKEKLSDVSEFPGIGSGNTQ